MNGATLWPADALLPHTYLQALNWGSLTIDWEATPSPRLWLEVRGRNGAIPLTADMSLANMRRRPVEALQ